MKRECGECIACCVWPKIIELNKPHFALCQYLKNKIGCTKNCKIHDNRRPKACIDYNCEWLKGHGRKEDRPDKCGIMFDNDERIKNSITAKPLWNGASHKEAGKQAIKRMSIELNKPVIVIFPNGLRIERIEGSGANSVIFQGSRIRIIDATV